jgi:hypothetical protein
LAAGFVRTGIFIWAQVAAAVARQRTFLAKLRWHKRNPVKVKFTLEQAMKAQR